MDAMDAMGGTPGIGNSEPQREQAERLLRDGARPVLRYLRAQADTPAQAEELAQETLVRAFVALTRGERPERPEAWLLGIARHVLLETWRSARSQRQLRARQEREALAMGPGWEGLGDMDEVDRRVLVGQAVDGLPPDLRTPVLLHYFGGLPVAEVAGHLETTTGAVKMRLLRARLALRAQLAELTQEGLKGARPVAPMRKRTAMAGGAALLVAGISPGAPAPLYRSISAGLETGGLRGATDPLSEPVFSGGHLSLDDLRFATERLRAARLAGERPLCDTLAFWPAPDPFNHPDPPAAWRLLFQAQVLGEQPGDAASRLVPTDGWRLGTDPDWRPLLERFKEAGLQHVWFTLVGVEETHDALCGRPGAFAAVVAAMERCAAVGLETGANVVVSTRNAQQLADLSRLVRGLGAERYVPTYAQWWTPAGHAYEAIRPEPRHLAGLPPAGLDANWGYREFWQDPGAHTEAALVREAIEATPARPVAPAHAPAEERTLSLIVGANLDVHAGEWWGHLRHGIANLRVDSPETIYQKLAALEPPPAPPSDAELARRYGDLNSRKVHTRLHSVRRKWLHAWRSEHQIPWLPWS
jgi:RNA polymerase sigma-70 factor (ECF subfamily)